MQTLLALLLVVAALGYLGRHVRRKLRMAGKADDGCASDCCGTSSKPAARH